MRKRARGTTGKWWLGTVVLLCVSALALSVCGCSCVQSLDAPAAGGELGAGGEDATTTTMIETAGLESTTTTTTAQPAPATTSTTASGTTTTFGFVPLQPTITVQLVTPQWNHIEENSGSIRYTGIWMGHIGFGEDPSYRSTNKSGAEAEVTFHGTKIRLVSVAGPAMGRAKLTLDGGSPVYVDLYAATEGSKIVWTSGSLSDDTHTLKIEWTGIKSPAATSTVITIDAIEAIGSFLL